MILHQQCQLGFGDFCFLLFVAFVLRKRPVFCLLKKDTGGDLQIGGGGGRGWNGRRLDSNSLLLSLHAHRTVPITPITFQDHPKDQLLPMAKNRIRRTKELQDD